MIEQPDEWVAAAEAAMPKDGTLRDVVHAVIGAVEPLIRADEREQIARAIEAELTDVLADDYADGFADGLIRAAGLARDGAGTSR